MCVLFEMNIDTAHVYKENKYAYFLTDITEFTPQVTPFKIGVRGYISKPNKDRLKYLHKFCKTGIKFKSFLENISAISVCSSYLIFLNRKNQIWPDYPPLIPPLQPSSHHTTQ